MADSRKGTELLRIGLRQVSVLEFVRRDDLLWRSPFLATLGEAVREELLRSARVRVVDEGAVLLEEDAKPDELHFVLRGSVVLAAGGGDIDLATLAKGDFFGLAAVVRDAVRPSAVAAEGGARVALLPGAMVESLARSAPAMGEVLAAVARQRRDRLRECSDFLDMW